MTVFIYWRFYLKKELPSAKAVNVQQNTVIFSKSSLDLLRLNPMLTKHVG